MFNGTPFSLLLLVGFCLLLPSTAYPQPTQHIYVSAASNCSNPPSGDGTPGCPFTGREGIQLAISDPNTQPGAVIHIAGGSYNAIVVDKELTLIADNSWLVTSPPPSLKSPTVEPDPSGNPPGPGVRIESGGGSSDSTLLVGLVVRNWISQLSPDGAGMQISPSSVSGSSPTIRMCLFENNTKDDFLGGGGAIQITDKCNPTITGCTFQSNTTAGGSDGAAIYISLEGSSMLFPCGDPPSPPCVEESQLSDFPDATIIDCCFIGNSTVAAGAGGAIAVEFGRASIHGCIFEDNIADAGGGALYSRFGDGIEVRESTFRRNKSRNTIGGAIYENQAFTTDYSRIIGNLFEENRAIKAGAVCVLDTNATISNNCFLNNYAQNWDGIMLSDDEIFGAALGIRSFGTTLSSSTALVVNNLFVANTVDNANPADDQTKSCVRVFTDPFFSVDDASLEVFFVNNTMVENADRGFTVLENNTPPISTTVKLHMMNSILWNNALSGATTGENFIRIGAAEVSCNKSDVMPMTPLDPEFDGSPACTFVDPVFAAPGDFHLSNDPASPSPLIDAGSKFFYNNVIQLLDAEVPCVDKDENPRVWPANSEIDMGCFEVQN